MVFVFFTENVCILKLNVMFYVIFYLPSTTNTNKHAIPDFSVQRKQQNPQHNFYNISGAGLSLICLPIAVDIQNILRISITNVMF